MQKITPAVEKKIHEAYLKNKERIDRFSTETRYGTNRKLPSAEETFKDSVLKYMGDDYKHQRERKTNLSVNEAIKKTLNSAKYSTGQEISQKAFLQGIREDKQAYEQWRKLTQHRKIDFSNLKAHGSDMIYSMPRYDIVISFTNSPVSVSVEKYEKASL